MTRAQLLADYLGVTPANAPGLYIIEPCEACGGDGMLHETGGDESPCMNCTNGYCTYLTHHIPGDPDLPRDVQAAWWMALTDHKDFKAVFRYADRYDAHWGGAHYVGRGPTSDAACLAALLAADAEFAKKWEGAG